MPDDKDEKIEIVAEQSAADEEQKGSDEQPEDNNSASGHVSGNGNNANGGQNNDNRNGLNDDTARKLILSLGYIIWILFFLPLVAYPNDAEAKRRANEQLNLFLFGVVGNVLLGILTGVFAAVLPVLSVIFAIVISLYDLCLLILGVVGIVYAVTGNDKPLPVVGAFAFIK